MKDRCPDCNSDDVIPWDDGLICCDCGTEFDYPQTPEDDEEFLLISRLYRLSGSAAADLFRHIFYSRGIDLSAAVSIDGRHVNLCPLCNYKNYNGGINEDRRSAAMFRRDQSADLGGKC